MNKIEVEFEADDLHLKFEGNYSDRMNEKLKREINTMLYSKLQLRLRPRIRT